MRKLVFLLLTLQCISCETTNDAGPQTQKNVNRENLSQVENQAYDSVPEEAFDLNEDLEIKVWAKTPLFHNPTNIDFDADGRIWLTEAVNYRSFNSSRNQGLSFAEGDRVVVLEDTDKDGAADKSTVFVQDKDLVAPLGISVFDNKIMVASSPNVIVYTDVDRNLKFDPQIDRKEIFLTGFGGLDHDHAVHAFVPGPDGALYTATGNAGPSIVTDKSGWTLRSGSSYKGGSPHAKDNQPGLISDDGRVWVGGLALRIDKTGDGLEVVGHNFRNSYELVLSSFGDMFQNDNDDPPACRTTWLMKYGNLGFSSADGERTWQADRRPGQSVPTAQWRQQDPGVIPAGDIYGAGAPTGITFYENGALGDKYNGLLLSAESGLGVIFGYFPKAKGAGFDLKRFDFLRSVQRPGVSPDDIHTWFRPADISVGPDGAIYVTDWFDPGVGGHKMSDPKSAGTIYRVTRKGDNPIAPKIDINTLTGQITALKSPAHSVRMLGYEALLQNKTNSSFVALRSLLNDQNPYLAARAIWVLAHFDKQGQKLVETLLKSENLHMRITAFRALVNANPELDLDLIARLIDDEHPGVRRELALQLRDVPFKDKKHWLVSLAKGYDGKDRWYLEALGIAAESYEAELYQLIKHTLEPGDPIDWPARFIGLAWRLHPPETVEAFQSRAMNSRLDKAQRQQAIDAIAFIPTYEAAMAMVDIAKNGPEDLQIYSDWWVKNRALKLWKAFDPVSLLPEISPSQRPIEITIDSAAYSSPFMQAPGNIQKIELDVSGANRLYLRVEAEDSDHDSNFATWIDGYFEKSDGTRVELKDIEWLAGNTSSGFLQYGFTANGSKIRRNREFRDNGIGVNAPSTIFYNVSGLDFKKFYVSAQVDPQYRRDEDEASASVKFQVFHDGGLSQNQTLATAASLDDIAAIKSLAGDKVRGQKLFYGRGICFTCHQVQEQGTEIGPDLTSIALKFGTDYLLDSLIYPSNAITFGYETVNIATRSGKQYNGFLVADADPIIIKDFAGKQTQIAVEEVVEKNASDVSMMPAAKALNLSGQDLMDIIAYLQSIH